MKHDVNKTRIGWLGLMTLLTGFGGVRGVSAADYTWTNPVSGVWSNTANWSPNGNPGSASGDKAWMTNSFTTYTNTMDVSPANTLTSQTIFNSQPGAQAVLIASALVNATSTTIGTGGVVVIKVSGEALGDTYYLNGGTLLFSFGGYSAPVPRITLNANSTIGVFDGQQVNAGGEAQGYLYGNGHTLTVSNNNSGTLFFNFAYGNSLGQLNVLSGTVGEDAYKGMPLREAKIVVSSNAWFTSWGPAYFNNAITLFGGGNGGLMGGGAGPAVYGGIITLTNGSSTLKATYGSMLLTNQVTGGGGLIIAGTYTNYLCGVNDYSGDTTMSGGNLVVSNALALQKSTLNYASGVSFGAGITNFSLGGLAGNTSLAMTNLAGAALSLSVGGNGSNTVYNGVLSQGGSLIKTGSGTLTLTGSNTYSGATIVSNGTLKPVNPMAALWLDATVGVTTNGTGNVTVWADQSGNGRNATGTGTTGPTVTTDINGLRTLRFTRANSQTLIGGIRSLTSLSIFIVHKEASPLTGLQTFIATQGTWRNDGTYGNSVHLIQASSGNKLDYAVYNADGISTTALQTTTPRLDEIIDNGGAVSFYLNGVADGTASQAATKNLQAFNIGSWDTPPQRYLDSSIGEILVYPTALSTADRKMVEDYLTSKWFGSGGTNIINRKSATLPTNTSLQIASGAILDLGGSTQTVASVLPSGGLVTNGSLIVTSSINLTNGATETLLVNSNLTVAAGATLNYDFTTYTSDVVNVTGNLTLSNVATVNVNRVSSGRMPNPAVLFNFGTGLGSAATDTNLANWVITGARNDTRAVVRGKQVLLVSPFGTMISIF